MSNLLLRSDLQDLSSKKQGMLYDIIYLRKEEYE